MRTIRRAQSGMAHGPCCKHTLPPPSSWPPTADRSYVEEAGGGVLEFFPLGGSPRVLIEFVVKHR